MATLYLSVYENASIMAHDPPLETLKVTIGGTSEQSAAITGDGGNRFAVRAVSDTACQVTRGENPGDSPTADADSEFFPANSVEYFSMKGGTVVAVIEQQ